MDNEPETVLLSKPGKRQLCVFGDKFVPLDYWAAVRNSLDTIHRFEEYEPNGFKEICSHIASITKYVAAIHAMHNNALRIIERYANERSQFVLYLRSFEFSGSGKLSRVGNEVRRVHGGWPAIVSDPFMLPALQRHFGSTPVLTLSNTDMFRGDTRAYNGIGGYRAHTYNWKAIVESLVQAAKLIVLLGHKYLRSVETECAYIEQYGREHETLCIVRAEESSINVGAFGDVGQTIDLYDFIEGKRPLSQEQAIQVLLKKEPESQNKISDLGKKMLNELYSNASDTHVKLEDIFFRPCFVVGRDFQEAPADIDLTRGGLFVQHSKVDYISAWAELNAAVETANEELNTRLTQKTLSPSEKRQRTSSLIALAARWLACSVELEQYDWMSEALTLLVAKYSQLVFDPEQFALLVQCAIYIDSLTERQRNKERITAMLEALRKGPNHMQTV